MANIPGIPGGQVSNEGDLGRILTDMQRQIRELAAQDLLTPVGITAQPNGITVTGTETVNGSLNVNGPMNVAGAMAVTGTLSLPAGIIGNDALNSPVYPLTVHADANNFSLATGANVTKVSATVSVPAGYTRALVFATAVMSVQNVNTSNDGFYLGCLINGASIGYAPYTDVPASRVGALSTSTAALLTNLGASFIINARASTNGYNWAAASGNVANLDAVVQFLR